MLKLKNSVPANWIAADHQVASRSGRSAVAWTSSSPAAAVKNSEPTKKTHASARAPTSWTKPGKGPTKKQSDPTAKPAATQRSDTGWSACRGAWTSAWPITENRIVGRSRGVSPHSDDAAWEPPIDRLRSERGGDSASDRPRTPAGLVGRAADQGVDTVEPGENARANYYVNALTARATIRPNSTSAIVAWTSIAYLARCVSGITSVGLKAVAFVKPRCR